MRSLWRKWFWPKEKEKKEEPAIPPWLVPVDTISKTEIIVLEYIRLLKIPTREGLKPGKPLEASRSEIKRWCDANNIWINGVPRKWNEVVIFPVESLVLFPKGQRVTIL